MSDAAVPMPNTNRHLATILGLAAVLGVVSAAGMGLYFGASAGVSSAVGTLLGMANFYALAKLVTVVIDDGANRKKRIRAALFLGSKFLVLVTIVGVLILKHLVQGGALMAGLSVVAIAIVIGGLVRSGDDDSTSPRSLS